MNTVLEFSSLNASALFLLMDMPDINFGMEFHVDVKVSLNDDIAFLERLYQDIDGFVYLRDLYDVLLPHALPGVNLVKIDAGSIGIKLFYVVYTNSFSNIEQTENGTWFWCLQNFLNTYKYKSVFRKDLTYLHFLDIASGAFVMSVQLYFIGKNGVMESKSLDYVVDPGKKFGPYEYYTIGLNFDNIANDMEISQLICGASISVGERSCFLKILNDEPCLNFRFYNCFGLIDNFCLEGELKMKPDLTFYNGYFSGTKRNVHVKTEKSFSFSSGPVSPETFNAVLDLISTQKSYVKCAGDSSFAEVAFSEGPNELSSDRSEIPQVTFSFLLSYRNTFVIKDFGKGLDVFDNSFSTAFD